MPKIAYSYIRFSSKKQELGHSLQRQAELSAAWCVDNTAVLDTSLKMDDRGVSGMKGKNLAPTAALGGFLAAVEDGRVAKGSYLLVENLDRLSRMGVDPAYQLFRSILLKGINIVTLQDKKTYTAESLNNFMEIIISLLVMTRANEESVTKQIRLTEKWKARRKNLPQKKITTRYPSWLSLNKDATDFIEIPAAVEAIKRIYTEYSTGTGVVTIATRLNKDGIPCISNRSKIWKTHYIQQLLRSRALIGEFQPKKRDALGNKEIAGVSFPTYFPAVIEEKLFNKVQFMLGKVPRGTAKAMDYGVNIFSGKLYCPYCGEKMFVAYTQMAKRLADGSRKVYGKVQSLTCVSARTGKCINLSWPLEDFKKQFLDCSTELQAMFSSRREEIGELIEAVSTAQISITAKERAVANLKKSIEEANPEDVPPDAMKHWAELNRQATALQLTLTARESELQAVRGANPYSNLKKLDVSNPVDSARLHSVVHTTIDEIYVFFAGPHFNHARAISMRARMLKDKKSPTTIAYAIRKELKIDSARFFTVHLSSPGKDKRLTYPKQGVALHTVEDFEPAVDPMEE